MKMKTADVLPYFANSPRVLGLFFSPPISRQAVKAWGEFMPELRVRQLVEKLPVLKKHVAEGESRPRARRAAGTLVVADSAGAEAVTSRG